MCRRSSGRKRGRMLSSQTGYFTGSPPFRLQKCSFPVRGLEECGAIFERSAFERGVEEALWAALRNGRGHDGDHPLPLSLIGRYGCESPSNVDHHRFRRGVAGVLACRALPNEEIAGKIRALEVRIICLVRDGSRMEVRHTLNRRGGRGRYLL